MSASSDDGPRSRLSYCLVATFPDGTVQSHEVTDEPVTIGRSAHATICVAEVAVSREHCTISSSEGRLVVLDKGSRNGTYINGSRVETARLGHGDVLHVGSARILVEALAPMGRPGAASRTAAPSRAPAAREQLALIGRTAAALARACDREQAGAVALDALLAALPVESGSVLLRSGSGGGAPSLLCFRSRSGAAAAEVEVSEKIVRQVLASGRPERHLADPVRTAPVLMVEPCLDSQPVLCAPLRSGDEVIGVIYLSSSKLPQWTGSAEVLALVTILADLAALAIGRLGPRLDLASSPEPGHSDAETDSGERLTELVVPALRNVDEETSPATPIPEKG